MTAAAHYRSVNMVLCLAACAIVLSGCTDNKVDNQRRAVLDHDPLITVQAPGTTPWIHQSDAGTGNGIGFGGTSPTVVAVTRHLEASRASVARYYAQTAIRSGWRVTKINCEAYGDGFSAGKQFDGFVATADVGVGSLFRGEPAVSVWIESSYHAGAETVLPSIPVAPLTISSLAQTCLKTAR
jgi:hypothetical protein